MEDTRTMQNLLLLLCFLPVITTRDDGIFKEETDRPNRVPGLIINGPDYVTLGVPCSFECFAMCSTACSYSMGLDGQAAQGQGNMLAFTVRQWVQSLHLTCTAKDDDTGLASTVTKTLPVLEGPSNVSISGLDLINPEIKNSYTCHASCHPSCHYTWQIGNHWLKGQGNEIKVSPSEFSRSEILTCKAINSISGLYATATSIIAVTNGPFQVFIEGPDTVKVRAKSKFRCSAECVPSCKYIWNVDAYSVYGLEIEITMERDIKSQKITCEAQNTISGKSFMATKTVYIGGNDIGIQTELATVLLLFALTVSILIQL